MATLIHLSPSHHMAQNIAVDVILFSFLILRSNPVHVIDSITNCLKAKSRFVFNRSLLCNTITFYTYSRIIHTVVSFYVIAALKYPFNTQHLKASAG